MSSILVLGIVLAASHAAWPAEPSPKQHTEWNPERTWVFAVSSTVWKFQHGLNMPQKGREDGDLVATLRERGVPAGQLVYLKDEAGTLARIQNRFQDLLAKTKPGDTLIFYFQGHGGRDISGPRSHYYFINYDANPKNDDTYWFMHQVLAAIEQHFHGSHVLLTADCCCSGGLLVEAHKFKRPLPVACLTSVAAHNTSTGAWTYTNELIQGFRGNPACDLNGDGSITLAELNQDIQLEMAIVEQQKASYAALHDFDAGWRIAPAPHKTHADIGKYVDALQDGKWYKARVEAYDGRRFQVSYVGYHEREWLEPQRIRDLQFPHLPVGARVMVTDDEKKHRPARVEKTFCGLHFVHFDDDKTRDHNLDQWFARDRLTLLP